MNEKAILNPRYICYIKIFDKKEVKLEWIPERKCWFGLKKCGGYFRYGYWNFETKQEFVDRYKDTMFMENDIVYEKPYYSIRLKMAGTDIEKYSSSYTALLTEVDIIKATMNANRVVEIDL